MGRGNLGGRPGALVSRACARCARRRLAYCAQRGRGFAHGRRQHRELAAGAHRRRQPAEWPQVVRLTLRADDERFGALRPHLAASAISPCAGVARDVSVETNLTEALIASRTLFRDLALCATDFAFETDADGIFTWVSPNGATGLLRRRAAWRNGVTRVRRRRRRVVSSRTPVQGRGALVRRQVGRRALRRGDGGSR